MQPILLFAYFGALDNRLLCPKASDSAYVALLLARTPPPIKGGHLNLTCDSLAHNESTRLHASGLDTAL